jgi:hypothetical protein
MKHAMDGQPALLSASRIKLTSQQQIARCAPGVFTTLVCLFVALTCLDSIHTTHAGQSMIKTPAPAPPYSPASARITAGAEWRAVDLSNAWPLKGSALDLSRFVEPALAGTYGRVIRTPEGHFAFERRPGQRVLFFGCSMSPELAFGKRTLSTKAEIEAYADHIRMQGYNLVRPHFLDHALTSGATQDLEFNADVLVRFDYFVKCLKDRGIYLYLDAMTSWKGYTKAPAWTEEANAVHLKERMYVDPAAREHWEAGVRKLLMHLNPYTNTRLLDDPIVAVLLFFNEQEINGWSHIPPLLEQSWRDYLRKKYSTMAALKAAWRDNQGKPLAQVESFDAQPLFTTLSLWEPNQRGLDAESFIVQMETEMTEWYLERIRAMGYRGLVSHFDYLKGLRNAVPRQRMDVISMHGYHAHPKGFTEPGAQISQTSSLVDAANYFRGMAVTRFGDRPFLLTEYGHVYWNRYRYEEGLVMGAYGALRDYDGLMAHAAPVLVAPEIIRPFSVGPDPVARASQVVAAFLFARRDVTPARSYVNLEIRAEELFTSTNIHEGPSGQQSHLPLVTGFGLSYTGQGAPPGIQPRRADAKLRVSKGAPVFADPTHASLADQPEAEADGTNLFGQLKSRGLLPSTNRTDTALGLYESENGQIFLDTSRRLMTVRTPRLEGGSFDALSGPLTLDALTVASSTVSADVTAISLDDAPLADSRRILLVYATDALNSTAQFDAPDRTVLRHIGKLPVLVRTGELKFTLRNQTPGMELWALGLDGARKQRLPVSVSKGTFAATVDTAMLTNGPALFFELANQ